MGGVVGPSNRVLDGGPDPPMVRGNSGRISPPPTEKRLDRVLLSVHDTCRPLAKDAEAIWRVECSGTKRSTYITKVRTIV